MNVGIMCKHRWNQVNTDVELDWTSCFIKLESYFEWTVLHHIREKEHWRRAACSDVCATVPYVFKYTRVNEWRAFDTYLACNNDSLYNGNACRVLYVTLL